MAQQQASCCPPGSLPYLAADHKDAGVVISVGSVECYATGNAAAPTAIIMAPDVWGWNGGRTRAIADHTAASLGAFVLVPKLLCEPAFEGGTDGDGLPDGFDIATRMPEMGKWVSQHSWKALQPKVESLLSCLKGKRVGMTGFCWGGWLLCQASALSRTVLCGVIAHPSVVLEDMIFGGSSAALASKVQCPVLFMPAGNDPPNYVPKGDIYEAVKAKFPSTETVNFPEMLHGWVPRGDLSDAAVKRDVEKAVNLMVDYLAKHLQPGSKL